MQSMRLKSLLFVILPYVASWKFTAIPPSTNPSSKLNLQLIDELANTLLVREIHVEDGRILFEPSIESPSFHSWSNAFDSGVRSIRVLANSYSNVTGTECEKEIVRLALDNLHWARVLSIWQDFGNVLPHQDDIRVHVKCRKWHTSVCRDLSSTELTNTLAKALSHETGWSSTSKRNAHFEVQLLLYYTHIALELAVLNRPTWTNELPHPGMKRVESFCVAKSAEIKTGSVVLDPMCGRATFLVEAAIFWPQGGRFIGVDRSHDQLKDAKINLNSCNLDQAVELHHGDSRHLAMLENETVDTIICCPPFGRQFEQDTNDSFRDLLLEWSRVLKADDGKMVLLIDEENVNALTCAIQNANCSVFSIRHSFRLGKLQATIVIAHKLKVASMCLPNRTRLSWENESPLLEKDRALWSRIRTKALPALVPVHSG